jgi:hypothetical protein
VLQLEKKDLRRMPGRIPARIREESGKNPGIISGLFPGTFPTICNLRKKKLVMIIRVVRPVEPSLKFENFKHFKSQTSEKKIVCVVLCSLCSLWYHARLISKRSVGGGAAAAAQNVIVRLSAAAATMHSRALFHAAAAIKPLKLPNGREEEKEIFFLNIYSIPFHQPHATPVDVYGMQNATRTGSIRLELSFSAPSEYTIFPCSVSIDRKRSVKALSLSDNRFISLNSRLGYDYPCITSADVARLSDKCPTSVRQ